MVSGGMIAYREIIEPEIIELNFPDTAQTDFSVTDDSQLFIEQKPSLMVYPNPTLGEFSIQLKNIGDEDVKLSVVNITGQVVRQLNANEFMNVRNNAIVNISDLTSGIYFVRMETADSSLTERIILTK